MKDKQIYFFIGTTAELIKFAPIIRELKKRKINSKIIASAQNSLQFNELKSIIGKHSAYYTLGMKPIRLSGFYFRFVIWVIKSIVNFLLYFRNEFRGMDKKNSFFLVHGDTVSSLIGAITARVHGIRLVHVESGLRSYNFLEPFPEELNRFIISHLANVHFCPNSWAVNNLKDHKGIKINTIHNTLIESLNSILKENNKLKYFKSSQKKFFLLVLHRQEHLLFNKNPTKYFLNLLSDYINKDLTCILVLHKLTERFLKQEGLMDKIKRNKNIFLVPRLPYGEFIYVMKRAEFVATDGGSNQEESYYLGKPCLLLRNVTERIEGLGENIVLGKGNENIIRDFFQNYKKYNRNRIKFRVPPSKIIVDYLIKH